METQLQTEPIEAVTPPTAAPAPARTAPAPATLEKEGSVGRFFRNTWAIAKKELGLYFTTPLAYVLFAILLVVLSVVFVILLSQYRQTYLMQQQFLQFQPNALDSMNFTDMIFTPLMGLAGTVMLFIIPFLSMRLVAEEKRQQTFALLMTSPVRTAEIVFGKFLATQVVLLFALGLTLTYPLLLNAIALDGGVEWRTALVSYLGLFLFASSMMAVGLFISALTESQLVAAVVTFGVSLIIWFLGAAASSIEDTTGKAIMEYLSMTAHLQSFLVGKIGLADLTYFLSVIVLGLFLTRTAIERTRW